MPKRKIVRPGDGGSASMMNGQEVARDPTMSALLLKALDSSVVATTKVNYDSATRQYMHFCDVRQFQAFPVAACTLGAFLLRKTTSVSADSLRLYVSAIRHDSISRGDTWTLNGNPLIGRVMRYIRRAFPKCSKGAKFSVTLGMIMKLLPLLPKWPDYRSMAYDDLLFATASVIAVLGFLRGGEFTYRKNQSRPILRKQDITRKELNGSTALIVNIIQAKSTWWEHDSLVPVFGDHPDSPFHPVTLYDALCARDPGASLSSPAFHFMNGKPLSRDFMLRKTVTMLQLARIQMIDAHGNVMPIKLASWRAGAVRSSIAENGKAVVKMQGRWSSEAWEHYYMDNSRDLGAASARMWQAAAATSVPQRVEGCTSTLEPDPIEQSHEHEVLKQKTIDEATTIAREAAQYAAKIAAAVSSACTCIPSECECSLKATSLLK